MESDPVLGTYISIVQGMVDTQRYVYRLRHPAMDASYIKWGYATEPLTGAGFKAKAWIDANIEDHQDLITDQIQKKLQGRTGLDQGNPAVQQILGGVTGSVLGGP
jgi:hypothetical protein